MPTDAFFAVTAPGLAPLAAAELRALGLAPGAPEPGGVPFAGPREALYRANLWLRTASRVLVRVDEFRARAFYELELQAKHLPWERFLHPGQAVRLRVTCRKSKLYHSAAVAERVAGAIAARVGHAGTVHAAAADDADDEGGAGALVVVRLLHDQCAISVDSSGALLHRRGYRLATAKAPLRETLAAAALLSCGYASNPGPLVDPFCGSGTIPIEAALLARNLAPGRARPFAFMDWPDFDGALWERLLAEARAAALPAAAGPIVGADRDAGAIAAARDNAARANVAADTDFRVQPLSALAPPPGPGWLIANPPYGARLKGGGDLRDLYAALGRVARERCPGWTVALVAADEALVRQTGLPFKTVLQTVNGGIAVRVVLSSEF
jgi:putative N6-adenine-specific DNA methylase